MTRVRPMQIVPAMLAAMVLGFAALFSMPNAAFAQGELAAGKIEATTAMEVQAADAATAATATVQPAAKVPALAKATKATKKTGWKKTKKGWVYYKKGVKVTGLQKIGSKRYYFNSKGIMQVGTVKVGKSTYYLAYSGELEGAKVGSKYFYNTLKPVASSDKYDFVTYVKAKKIVANITKKSDSKASKLSKAFNWVMKKSYVMHRQFNPWAAHWPATYARDHFNNIGGDCHADGAAFAYLAAAIGYKADVCIDAVQIGVSHCWCMIGNKVYDPLFAESKSYWGYYGATSGTYEVNPTARYRVPQYSPKNAKASAKASKTLINSGKTGLFKEKGSYYYYNKGVKLKGAWKTVNDKRYYFKSNGKAATGSYEINDKYWVFNSKGVLKKQPNAKTSKVVIKLGKKTYQVKKNGRAAAGWNADKTMRFDETGLLMTGTSVVSGKFYVADSKGIYDAEQTAALNAAAKKGQPAADLKALLGKPKSEDYAEPCAGEDGAYGIWQYKKFNVITFKPVDETAVETVVSVEVE